MKQADCKKDFSLTGHVPVFCSKRFSGPYLCVRYSSKEVFISIRQIYLFLQVVLTGSTLWGAEMERSGHFSQAILR